MYIYIYIYVCVCVYTYVHLCICIYIHICMHICIYTCIRMNPCECKICCKLNKDAHAYSMETHKQEISRENGAVQALRALAQHHKLFEELVEISRHLVRHRRSLVAAAGGVCVVLQRMLQCVVQCVLPCALHASQCVLQCAAVFVAMCVAVCVRSLVAAAGGVYVVLQ